MTTTAVKKPTDLVPSEWDTGPIWGKKRNSSSVKEAFRQLGAMPRTELTANRPFPSIHTVRILPESKGKATLSEGGILKTTLCLLRGGSDSAETKKFDVLDTLDSRLSKVSDIHFCRESEDHPRRCEFIKFPLHMRQNMLRFLKENPHPDTWQCSDLANIVHGKFDLVELRVFIPGIFDWGEWDFAPFGSRELKNGDTIYMSNGKPGEFHYAVLLSKEDDHWISKRCPGGPLVITTLEEMKRDNALTHIEIITPKTNTSVDEIH